jgi:MFS family permease
MTHLTYRNGVSIAEIVVYVPALCIAAFLAIRHGLGQNSGWLFLILFCLARIIGPCMQLAEISHPTDLSLFEGSAILQNVALSPLMLATIGLLSRLLESIHRSKRTVLHSSMFHLIHLIIIVGLILGIVGGTDAANSFITTGKYTPTDLNKAGTALFIVAYIAMVTLILIISFHVSHAEKGEKRLFIAVVISLPFILVRLVYSIISTFTHNKNFNLLTGSVTVFLCVALIEEFIVVAVYEGTGLTLKKASKDVHYEATQQIPSRESAAPIGNQYSGAGQATVREKQKENAFLKVAKYTIMGRLVMAAMAAMPKKNEDVEMQQRR